MTKPLNPPAVRLLRGDMSVKQAATLAMVAPRTWHAWEMGENAGKPLLMPGHRAELFRLRLAESVTAG